jgi:hypothetical protein
MYFPDAPLASLYLFFEKVQIHLENREGILYITPQALKEAPVHEIHV